MTLQEFFGVAESYRLPDEIMKALQYLKQKRKLIENIYILLLVEHSQSF